jgi:hypothetical protein
MRSVSVLDAAVGGRGGMFGGLLSTACQRFFNGWSTVNRTIVDYDAPTDTRTVWCCDSLVKHRMYVRTTRSTTPTLAMETM